MVCTTHCLPSPTQTADLQTHTYAARDHQAIYATTSLPQQFGNLLLAHPTGPDMCHTACPRAPMACGTCRPWGLHQKRTAHLSSVLMGAEQTSFFTGTHLRCTKSEVPTSNPHPGHKRAPPPPTTYSTMPHKECTMQLYNQITEFHLNPIRFQSTPVSLA